MSALADSLDVNTRSAFGPQPKRRASLTLMKAMKSPSRGAGANSPLRVWPLQPNGPPAASVVNDSQLLRAIQTLDAIWKPKNRTQEPNALLHAVSTSAVQQVMVSPLPDALREALCVLLEITARFDKSGSEAKTELETVCAARILGCLQRFVSGWKAPIYPRLGGCCERKCEQHVVQLSLLCILFQICREPQLARSVVKEELHVFLSDMCTTNESSSSGSHGKTGFGNAATDNHFPGQRFDPLDLLIAIDPFDWCYQPLCTRLVQEDSEVFLAPLGTRSLVCVLKGTPLPTDEITEFEQHLHPSQSHPKAASNRPTLPSVFTFPNRLNTDHAGASMAKTHRQKLPPLCHWSFSARKEHDESLALWRVVLDGSARTHLALRSLVALALHLPRPSRERRHLLHDISYSRRIFESHCKVAESHQNANNSRDSAGTGSTAHLRAITLGPCFLQRMALTGMTLMYEDEPRDTSIPDKVAQSPSGMTQAHTGDLHDARLPSQSRIRSASTGRKPVALPAWTLVRRLKAAAGDADTEVEQQYRTLELQSDRKLERSRRRYGVRTASHSIENLRSHFMSSLGVLYFGRDHPDPQQTFAQWIQSLPTLETREQERQLQQQMRERQALEQQFQREAVRRRERNECTQMQFNDYNVPEESELAKQQEKRERFMRMQAEIRELEKSESGKEAQEATTEALAKKKKREELEAEERKRLVLLEAQKREARELIHMQREDLYYVEQIMQARVRAKQQQEREKQVTMLRSNAIEEQQQRIVRMRFLDQERQLAGRESDIMRAEDLLGRQMRFREAEQRKAELQNEWRTRKAMQAEEHDSRARWVLLHRELERQQQEELKQQRAEARRLRRQQQREEQTLRAAWIESWDEQGNQYYYNSLSGLSQWEAPT